MIALREMDDNDLKDIGVDQTIYRKRIIDAVAPKVNTSLNWRYGCPPDINL